MKNKILITGASGFLGKALTLEALSRGFSVIAVSRSISSYNQDIEIIPVGDIDGETDWLNSLKECNVVVHLAARAHMNEKNTKASINEFRKVNVEGTINLARQAAISGVKRFVFISTIGVNGANTLIAPFKAGDDPAPHSPYSISKYEAELGLQALSIETGMEFVTIRPPLIYGPNAPGNFGLLMRWVSRGLPMPFGAVTHNRRSFVAIDNVVDFILACVTHPKAVNQTFLVSDGEDISTTDLLKRIGQITNRPVRLIQVPVAALFFSACILGKRATAQSLLTSLQIDISKNQELLNWKPPFSVNQGLHKALGADSA